MGDETNLWEKHDLESKITTILASFTGTGHHFGRPFITGYQLAIAFAEHYPDTAEAIGLSIGGVGTGQHTSLSQRLPWLLSRRIEAGSIRHIEGAFLSHVGMTKLAYRHGKETVHASIPGPESDGLSMFRLRESE